MRKLFIILFVLLLSSRAWAANHYIRDGATGSSPCSDWSSANACDALPATLVRGDTYYIASGSYSGRTFNTATSGTQYITIKGATAADHGTDTGWSNGYSVSTSDGGSQAVFTSNFTISTSYWNIDGVVGPVLSQTPALYGFSMGTSQATGFIFSAAVSNIIISHLYAKAGTSSNNEREFIKNNSGCTVTNLTISHCLLDSWQGFVAAWLADVNYLIFEYNVCLNLFSSGLNHGECVNPNGGGMNYAIFRYNWFEGYSTWASDQSGATGCIVANNNDNANAEIYGNVFYNLWIGNGVITNTSQGNMLNAKVYNNTFTGITYGVNGAIIVIASGTVYNNISYNVDNSSISGGTQANNTNYASSPFVDYANKNFHLAAPTSAGTSLSSPYNMDVDGNIRGGDGTWDRGAYEYGASVNYTVTPSSGANGSISPNTPQQVASGFTTQFTVTPDTGYTASVGGTCGGSLVGTTYTTNAITANCTVVATFSPTPVTPTTFKSGKLTGGIHR